MNPSTKRKMEQSASSFSRCGNDQSSEVGSVPSTPPYDAFISHPGSNPKAKDLATIICYTLRDLQLRVFLDSADLSFYTTRDAIRTSSVQIAIFSENYAESTHCLNELVLMVETGAPIVPVFYDVEPRDLRDIERGVYANAFARHQKTGRYSSQMLGEWKKALHHVSSTNGLRTSDTDHESLCQIIVNEVLKGVRAAPFGVAKLLVGLDRTVQDFENFLLDAGQKVDKIVGIVGMGGSGKTTQVQELYSRKRSLFGRSSFLPHVREAYAKNLLQTLQGKLLKDLGCTKHNIETLTEGKGILRNCLRSSPPVLIILDDIDHVDQLDALLVTDGLRCGSLVIVTSRDEDVLRRAGISWIYKIRGLDPKHARELFCRHAFLQPFPPNGFEHLVEDFLQGCGGLPLSLKVFGGHFYGTNDEVYWRSELRKVSKLPPDDIKSRMKISYDALDIEEKMIFLDIACFFLGEDKGLALRIWNGSGWSGYHCFQILVQKCLVELDDRNRLKMHDLLRELGTDIANEVSPCRLWRPVQATNILKLRKGRTAVRGIMAATSDDNSHGYPKCTASYPTPCEGRKLLKSFVGVKLLVIQGNWWKKWHRRFPKELVWLRWYDYLDVRFPHGVLMKNLRVLELIDGDSPVLWRRDIEAPLELRELNIYSSIRLRELPASIGLLRHLEKMDLSGLVKMRTLPEEFCNLKSLKQLGLRNCESLTSLPHGFGKLTNLQRIQFNGCSKLQALPESFGGLTNLQHIEFNDCSELRMLQESFGNLTSLQHIQFNGCTELRTLPRSFGQLKLLRYLDLSWCRSLVIESEMLGEITSLNYLLFTGCEKLEALPIQVSFQRSLRELNLFNTSLQQLPNEFGTLINLEVMRIGSPFLTSLPPSFGSLSCLTELWLDGCRELKFLPESLGELNRLTSLSIMNSGVCYLPKEVGKLKNLRSLSIRDCPVGELLPTNAKARKPVLIETTDFKEHRNTRFQVQFGLSIILDSSIRQCILPLKIMDLSHTKLSKVSFHSDICPKLEYLSLSCNEYLTEVETLPTTLVDLRMDRCTILKRISGISDLRKLQNLDISGCCELDELPCLANLSCLKEFKASGCRRLQSIQGLEDLANLEQLDISECSEIDDLPGLSRLSCLKNLVINGCSKLQGIEFLVHLSSLERLEADGLESYSLLKTLPEELCHLKSLKHLELRNCESFRSLPRHFGEHLTNLQYLDFSHWENLEMLPKSLGHSMRLRYLDLSFCKNLKVQPEILENIGTLEELNFEYCEKLKVLPNLITLQGSLRALNLIDTCLEELPSELGNLSNLEVLRIGSPFLTSLPSSIGNLRGLTKLELEGCRKLKLLPNSVGQLTRLAHLSIKWSQVTYLPPEVAWLTSLQTLTVWDCPITELSIPTFPPSMSRLRSIDLRHTKLSRISIVASAYPNLEHLRLCDNECLFKVVISVPTLLELSLKGCSKLERISGIRYLERLRLLDISGCCELRELPGVAYLSNSLERLEADGCWKLQSIEGLDQLERLTYLKLPAGNSGIWSCIQRLQKLPSDSASIILNMGNS